MTIQPLWTANDIARAIGGNVDGAIIANGVSIDSRSLEPGDIFVALNGPGLARDGHEFVAQALAAGASAALVSRDDVASVPDPRIIKVPDTQIALESLGRARRAAVNAHIIGVTGSVGKTGTKEALRHVLSAQGHTHASAASYNNLWGVPLSLARMPLDSRFGVFEMGMNHGGEITPLSHQVRPHAAIITTVEPVHLEFFASVAEIANAKAEIFAGMEQGVAILNRDNPYFDRLVGIARQNIRVEVLSFGADPSSDMRLIEFRGDDTGSMVEVDFAGRKLSGRIGQPGRHIAQNCLAILAGVHALGGDVDQAMADLSTIGAIAGRGLRQIMPWGQGQLMVIDESYNASPPSVRAALAVLASVPAKGRRIVVLGDMRELGAEADDLHRGLCDAVMANADLLFACGRHMRALFDAVGPDHRGAYAENSAALAPMLREALQADDVVMIKGSLGSAMRVVVQDLLGKVKG
jgi:UDP-N-acetylmuramoyl-tripeptide--D-alanyl-D-alanine ligase